MAPKGARAVTIGRGEREKVEGGKKKGKREEKRKEEKSRNS